MKTTKIALSVLFVGLASFAAEASSPRCTQWVKPNFGKKYCAQVASTAGTSGITASIDTTTTTPTGPGKSGQNGNGNGGNGNGPAR